MPPPENKCWRCFGFIRDERVRYQEKQFHTHCFYCEMCKKSLSGIKCHEEGGKLYDEQCYTILQEDKCARCRTLIKSGGQTYKGKSYHAECFTCQDCRRSLEGLSFHTDEGRFYCEGCFRNHNALECNQCKGQIDGNDINYTIFQGKNYHHKCFLCAQCHRSLSGQSFKMILGQRYCKSCR